MPDQNDKVYQFAPLDGYSLKQRLLIRLADLAFYVLIRAVCVTVRFDETGIENLNAAGSDGRTPIYAVWHDRIFLGTYHLRKRGIVFLTSQSFDGEYIARFLQRFGYGAVRGSSTRGGARALVEMIRKQDRGFPTGFTVDGPKGPRHVAKPGPLMIAKKTGDSVVPFSITPKRFFTIRSWDRLIIPWPFTRASVVFGEPINVDSNADDQEIKAKLAELQNSLDRLEEKGNT